LLALPVLKRRWWTISNKIKLILLLCVDRF
jgi:hypothetical protein